MVVNGVSFAHSGVPAPSKPTQQRLSKDDAHWHRC